MTTISTHDLGAEYSRIFGQRQEGRGTGRSRLCRHCGDWHRLEAWPHNCRDEASPRANLAAPMLAPRFGEFQAGDVGEPVTINDRRQKRDFMAAHDLVEYEPLTPEPEPSERAWREEFMSDLKQVMETDPLNRPPIERLGEGPKDAPEVDTTDLQVFK